MVQKIYYLISVILYSSLVVVLILNPAFGDEIYLETLENAIAAYKSGKSEQVHELIKKCALLEPNNYLSWYWAGIMCESDHASLLNFDRAIELAPNEPDPYAMRGRLKLQTAHAVIDSDGIGGIKDVSMSLIFDSNYIEGIKDIENALRLDSDNVPACYYKATDLMESNKNREALPYLQKIVDKKNIENDTLSKSYLFNFRENSHFVLCTIYCQLQMYDKALEHINIAIQSALLARQTDTLCTYYQQRYQLNKNMNKENALKDIDKIIEIDSSQYYLWMYHKTCILFELNRKEESIVLCTKMLTQISSDSAEYIVFVHYLATELNCYDVATMAIDKCNEDIWLKNHQSGVIDNDVLGVFYITRSFLNNKRNLFDNAYDDISKVVQLEPKVPKNYLMRAKILFRQDKSSEMLKDIETFFNLLSPDEEKNLP
ncbi:MAG: hypothetical protein LBI18_08135 [Planctomycetaceae bacterium]|jgi:tetratricopeptide (TPR) repeat protein|nr:hypothetical protein [Planctomycetaceae bacterium]